MGRLFRAAAAGFAVLLTLAGLPVALVVFQRTVDWDWQSVVAQPLSVGGLVAAGVGAGWLLWLLLVRLVMLDAVDAVRHVARAPRLPVPLHTAVTAAAGGLMLLVNALRGGAEVQYRPPAVSVVDAATWNPGGDAPATSAGSTAQPATASIGSPGSSHSSGGPGGDGTPAGDAAPVAGGAGFAAGGPDIGGVSVPGGWLPLPVLAAIGGAAAALWAQRRRGYRPRPPAGAHRVDGDLVRMPALLQQLLRYDRIVTDVGDNAAALDGLASDPVAAPVAVTAGASTAGRSDSPTVSAADAGPADEALADAPMATAVVAAAVPWPGVGLVGPGAHDAARGLLVALSTDPHPEAPPVTVTAGALHILLGAGCTAVGSARLRVADGHLPPAAGPQEPVAADPASRTSASLTSVSRTRVDAEAVGEAAGDVLMLNDADAAISAAMPGAGPPFGGWPPMRMPVAADTPSADRSGGGRVVRLGAWPGAATWVVAEDGAVHVAGAAGATGGGPGAVGGPGRVAVLDQQTARAVLTGLGLLTIPSPVPPAAPPSPGVPPPQLRSGDEQVAAPAGHPVDDGPGGVETVGESWPRTPPGVAHLPRRLRVRVLGQPAVLRPYPDGAVTPVTIRRSAARQILLLLAVRRAPVTADTVKETVWPDVASRAAHRLYLTNMSELRRALADAAGQPVLQQATNRARPGLTRYWLDPDTVDVDVWRLHDLLDAADSTVEQARRLRLLRQAADLCGGDLADGCTEEWLTVDRERVARHALDLWVHLADLEADHDTAVRLLRRAARDAPGNEAVHRRLLLRHAAAGDSDGLRRAAAALAEHLTAAGAAPEPDTAALVAGLLPDVPEGLHVPAEAAAALGIGGPGTARGLVERSRP